MCMKLQLPHNDTHSKVSNTQKTETKKQKINRRSTRIVFVSFSVYFTFLLFCRHPLFIPDTDDAITHDTLHMEKYTLEIEMYEKYRKASRHMEPKKYEYYMKIKIEHKKLEEILVVGNCLQFIYVSLTSRQT